MLLEALFVDDLAPESEDDLLSLFEAEEALSEALLPEEVLGEESATLRLLVFLKSVSYQPLPFKRNPAAEISRFKVSFSQAGQSFSGSSLMR